MRLPQLQRPVQAAVMAGGYRPVLASFALPTRPMIPTAQTLRVGDAAAGGAAVEGRRYASVKSQGAYRIPNKKTIAKKLGAKRSGDQFVIPGNIIFKQRGTMWHAGFNAIRGRDHTIHAAATGYVKYYRDPSLHPDKQYIGVAFNKEDKLPYPKLEPRRRKLGMVATVRKKSAGPRPKVSDSGIPNRVLRKAGLFNIDALERRLWNADKRAELKLAAQADARAAKAGRKGIRPEDISPIFGGKAASEADAAASKISAVKPTAFKASAASEPVVKSSTDVTSPDAFAAAAISNTATQGDASTPTTASQSAASQSPTVTSPGTSVTTASRKAKSPSSTSNRKFKTLVTKSGRRVTIDLSLKRRIRGSNQAEPAKAVTAGEYLQKTWLERRGTRVLLLNPRTYAYAESNAAIGRLSARNMYTAPWKLGGRKSRMRSRRKRWVAKTDKKAADRALVRTEREKERVAAEKKRADKLAKQRERGSRKAAEDKTATMEVAAVAQAAEAVEAAAAVEEARPAEAAILVDSAAALVEAAGLPTDGAQPVDGAVAVGSEAIVEKAEPVNSASAVETAAPVEAEAPVERAARIETAAPVEASVNEPLADFKEASKSTETQDVARPVEDQASTQPNEAMETEMRSEVQNGVRSIETAENAKPVKSQATAQPVEAEESSQSADAKEAQKPVDTKESDEPTKP